MELKDLLEKLEQYSLSGEVDSVEETISLMVEKSLTTGEDISGINLNVYMDEALKNAVHVKLDKARMYAYGGESFEMAMALREMFSYLEEFGPEEKENSNYRNLHFLEGENYTSIQGKLKAFDLIDSFNQETGLARMIEFADSRFEEMDYLDEGFKAIVMEDFYDVMDIYYLASEIDFN